MEICDIVLPPHAVVRCHDPTAWSTSDFVGDLVQVSNESGALRGPNGWSRTGMGEKILGSTALTSVGEVGVRDPENADVGNGGESKRGRPAFTHKNFFIIVHYLYVCKNEILHTSMKGGIYTQLLEWLCL